MSQTAPLSVDDVAEWLQERLDNCHRIAATKVSKEVRDGWLEDAAYFHAAIAALRASPELEPYRVACHCDRCGEDGDDWDMVNGLRRCPSCDSLMVKETPLFLRPAQGAAQVNAEDQRESAGQSCLKTGPHLNAPEVSAAGVQSAGKCGDESVSRGQQSASPDSHLIQQLRAWESLADTANDGWNIPPEGTEALKLCLRKAANSLSRAAAPVEPGERRGGKERRIARMLQPLAEHRVAPDRRQAYLAPPAPASGEVDALKDELERERMRLAACGVAALGADVSECHERYLSASLSDVLRLREREVVQRAAIEAALNELGIPQPDYPAPVTNAVGILRKALRPTQSATESDALLAEGGGR